MSPDSSPFPSSTLCLEGETLSLQTGNCWVEVVAPLELVGSHLLAALDICFLEVCLAALPPAATRSQAVTEPGAECLMQEACWASARSVGTSEVSA